MNPNLFRSISRSLAESFPLLPRIRRSFWGLLLFCSIFLLLDLSADKGASVTIKPVNDTHYQNPTITKYPAGAIQTQGLFTLDHPTIVQRLLFPGPFTSIDFATLLFMCIASVIMIRIIPKLENQSVFREDITRYIRILGYLLMLHGIFTIYRTIEYIPREIERLTGQEYTGITHFPILIGAELYVSLVVLALAGFYKKGIELQKEQDLTI